MFKLLFLSSIILSLQILPVSAQYKGNDCSSIKYRGDSVLQPEPFAVKKIEGTVVSNLVNSKTIIQDDACIALFNEKTKKLVKTIEAGKGGEFSFKGIKEGKYRLIVVTDDYLYADCIASIRVDVKKRARANQSIVVHMEHKWQIDICSYGELVENSPK